LSNEVLKNMHVSVGSSGMPDVHIVRPAGRGQGLDTYMGVYVNSSGTFGDKPDAANASQ
jgi:hypothetical protein